MASDIPKTGERLIIGNGVYEVTSVGCVNGVYTIEARPEAEIDSMRRVLRRLEAKVGEDGDDLSKRLDDLEDNIIALRTRLDKMERP